MAPVRIFNKATLTLKNFDGSFGFGKSPAQESVPGTDRWIMQVHFDGNTLHRDLSLYIEQGLIGQCDFHALPELNILKLQLPLIEGAPEDDRRLVNLREPLSLILTMANLEGYHTATNFLKANVGFKCREGKVVGPQGQKPVSRPQSAHPFMRVPSHSDHALGPRPQFLPTRSSTISPATVSGLPGRPLSVPNNVWSPIDSPGNYIPLEGSGRSVQQLHVGARNSMQPGENARNYWSQIGYNTSNHYPHHMSSTELGDHPSDRALHLPRVPSVLARLPSSTLHRSSTGSSTLDHDRTGANFNEDMPPPHTVRSPFPSPRTEIATYAAELPSRALSSLAEHPGHANRGSTTADQGAPSPLNNARAAAGEKRPASRRGPPVANSRGRRKRQKLASAGSLASAHTSELGVSQEVLRRAVSSRPGVTTRSSAARTKHISATEDRQQPGVMPTDTGVANTDETATTAVVGNPCMHCRTFGYQCDLSKPDCGSCKLAGRKCHYANLPVNTKQSHNDEYKNGSTTSGGQIPVIIQVPSDAATKVLAETSHTATQTEGENKTFKYVKMEDAATNTTGANYVDASVSTANCDDMWLPCSQIIDLMSWATSQSVEQLERCCEVLRTTDPSREDHQYKMSLAAQYSVDYHSELQRRCEEAVRLSS